MDKSVQANNSSSAIAATLFATLFFVFGSAHNTGGVFFVPLLKEFGGTRAHLSTFATAMSLAMGASAPLVGFALDRVGARDMILAGSALTAAGLILASYVHSFHQLLAIQVVWGLGIEASTLIPASLVIARRFDENRGLAMGLTMAGASSGAMVMSKVAAGLIQAYGWRTAYAVLSAPILLIVLPLVAIYVPAGTVSLKPRSPSGADSGEGLLLREALACRSFWLIALAEFCFSFATSGPLLHLVPYLLKIGYRPGNAAWALGMMFGFGTLGKLALGPVADRVGSRRTLALIFSIGAVGIFLMLWARSSAILVACVLLYGITVGVPLMLIPLMIAECLGMREFGAISGLIGFCFTLGTAIGPVAGGLLFDLTGGYQHAFLVFAAVLCTGSFASISSRPLQANLSANRWPVRGVAS